MLNKTVVIPVFSAVAMTVFTVWALLAGPADAARVAPAGALTSGNTCPTQCAAPTAQKLAER